MERIELTVDEVLDILCTECTVPNYDPDAEFLIEQFAERAALSMAGARHQLDRLVKEGRITMRWVRTLTGKRAKAFRMQA